MHKLLEYVCDELEELERKADKGGKLSMAEIQYGDTLAHMKKNLLTADAMTGDDEEGYSNTGYSYARGRGQNARRDSMGRYSRETIENRGGSYENNSYTRGNNQGGRNRGGSYYSRGDAREELAMDLKELKMDAKDHETAQMIDRWIKQLEQD